MFPSRFTTGMFVSIVKIDGMALRLVDNQTHKICLEAVRNNGMALQFVRVQSHMICMAAVQQNGLALQFVEQQTPDMCILAIRQNVSAVDFVRKKTRAIFATVRRCTPVSGEAMFPFDWSLDQFENEF